MAKYWFPNKTVSFESWKAFNLCQQLGTRSLVKRTNPHRCERNETERNKKVYVQKVDTPTLNVAKISATHMYVCVLVSYQA